MSEVRKKLDEPIPRSAVATRSGGNGVDLSYLTSFYVIQKLNEILGQGNWAYSSEVNNVYTGEIDGKYGKSFTTSYIARVRLVVTIDGNSTEFTDYGYGDGTDKKSPGKAHELAVKEAVTDGLKRCAKNLGMALGLALYDKEQEFVSETGNSNSSNRTLEPVVSEIRQNIQESSNPPKKVSRGSGSEDVGSSEKRAPRPTKILIKDVFDVLESLKKISKADFKEKYLSGSKIADLTDDQALVVINKMKTDFPEIKLA